MLNEALANRWVAEFFAGIGLMRMGLERAGWRVRFANDIDADKQLMYRRQFSDEDAHFVLGDVHELRGSTIPTVGLATASFPCTDLSLAGMRKGLAGEHSSAFWGFVNALKEMGARKPPLVLLENVAGFLTSRGGQDITEALLALNRLGYSVDIVVLDAARFVPQSRVRLFVVGSADCSSEPLQSAETPLFYESPVRGKAVADFIFAHPEINWSIRNLPDPPTRTLVLSDLMEILPDDDPQWWSPERTDYLLRQMSPKHAATLRGLMSKRQWTHATVFRRVRNGKSMAELRTDQIAGCLRTPRGGSGRQILVEAGFGRAKVRLLTPRECARLMGADDFRIETSLNKALFGFGDAVCVPVIEWLAMHYLNPLAEAWLKKHGAGLGFPARRTA